MSDITAQKADEIFKSYDKGKQRIHKKLPIYQWCPGRTIVRQGQWWSENPQSTVKGWFTPKYKTKQWIEGDKYHYPYEDYKAPYDQEYADLMERVQKDQQVEFRRFRNKRGYNSRVIMQYSAVRYSPVEKRFGEYYSVCQFKNEVPRDGLVRCTLFNTNALEEKSNGIRMFPCSKGLDDESRLNVTHDLRGYFQAPFQCKNLILALANPISTFDIQQQKVTVTYDNIIPAIGGLVGILAPGWTLKTLRSFSKTWSNFEQIILKMKGIVLSQQYFEIFVDPLKYAGGLAVYYEKKGEDEYYLLIMACNCTDLGGRQLMKEDVLAGLIRHGYLVTDQKGQKLFLEWKS